MGIGTAIKGAAFRGWMLAERAFGESRYEVPLVEIRNFLLLQHATALGAVVHATPLVAALEQAVPGCRIVVAASGISAEIFRDNPGVEAVIATPSPLRDLWGAAKALRQAKPFAGEPFATITSVANERTRVALSAAMAGAGNRVGFAIAPELYSAPLALDRSISLIANNLRIVEALGHVAVQGATEPRVFFTASDLSFAWRTLREAGVGETQPVAVFVTQTSVTQRKSWRPERFQAAAEWLREQYGVQILFVGTADEASAIDRIRKGISFKTINVAGKTNLKQLTALLSVCDLALALDTGTMHLGRAVELPMVIIAPAWSPAVEWLPVGNPRCRILKKLHIPAETLDYVIDEVSVDDVNGAFADLLNCYPVLDRDWRSAFQAGDETHR